MIWDCKFCGTANLPAKSHLFCPNCGASQDPTTRRFPSDEEKQAVADHVFKGASLICNACGTTNAGDAQFCQQCGAPLENAARATSLGTQVRAENAAFSAQGATTPAVPVQENKRSGPNWVVIGVVAAIALLIVGAIVTFTWRRDTAVAIVGHDWQRTISIEQFTPIDDVSWCDSMPNDAYRVSERREQRTTRQVADGEDCQVRRVDNGDGTFSERRECTTRYRDEPVYDDRCYYTVNRWMEARTLDSSGESLTDAPRWPLLQLAQCSGNSLGCEREAGRQENYTLTLEDAEGKPFTCPVSAEMWQAAQEGTRWNVQIGVVTGQPDCSTLERIE